MLVRPVGFTPGRTRMHTNPRNTCEAKDCVITRWMFQFRTKDDDSWAEYLSRTSRWTRSCRKKRNLFFFLNRGGCRQTLACNGMGEEGDSVAVIKALRRKMDWRSAHQVVA